jgi:hypothetical protein
MGGSWTVEISMKGVQVQMVARARYHLGSEAWQPIHRHDQKDRG